jgi:hypothetical protein
VPSLSALLACPEWDLPASNAKFLNKFGADESPVLNSVLLHQLLDGFIFLTSSYFTSP